MRSHARVTAVVLNYNGRRLLDVVLPSLAAQRYRNFTTVVVDNGSEDDSREYLSEHWPEVEVVSIAQNIGVAAALNRGVRAAHGEYVALLNNDVELERECLAELVGALDRHPQAGVACGKLRDFNDREVLDGAGDVYTWGGEASRRGQGERDVGQYERPQDIFSACGALALYRRAALDSVGPFDARLFANLEDLDWCFRAQLAGLGCRYVPSALAYHVGSATLGKGPTDFALYHNWRNGIWVVAKNYPIWELLRHAHQLAFVQVRNLAIATRRGRLPLWLRVWRDALAAMPAVLRERRRIQRSRVISFDRLDALITASSSQERPS
jgi:GT2 family glycosyltransferase